MKKAFLGVHIFIGFAVLAVWLLFEQTGVIENVGMIERFKNMGTREFIVVGAVIGVFLIVSLIMILWKKAKPEMFRQNEIEEKDERNKAIRGKMCETVLSINTTILICLLVFCVTSHTQSDTNFFLLPLLLIIGVLIVNIITMIAAVIYYNTKM